MSKIKKVGIPVLTLAMSFGMMSVGNAQTNEQQPARNLMVEVASTEISVTKGEVVNKFKELFSQKFDFLSEGDFHMSTGHYYPDNEVIRYDLSFSKYVQGKEVYGYATFTGDNLALESFNFEPTNKKEALFPAKVTKEEAQKVAQNFIGKFSDGKQFKLDQTNSDSYYYYSNQLLTEPIQYHFSFIRTENNIEIADQRMEVTVLGNGEVVQFYQYPVSYGKNTFDKAEKLISEDGVLSKLKDNLNLQLQYQVSYDYRADKPTVKLVYAPLIQQSGVSALTGQWLTGNGFSENPPKVQKIEKVVQQPLNPNPKDITVEDAKAIAKKLLTIDLEDSKLRLESIEERSDSNGSDLISVYYSYESSNGQYGTSLELNKQTGEVIYYHNIKNEVLNESGKTPSNAAKISTEQALSKAIDYLKEWVPASLHHYIKPLAEPGIDEDYGVYYFTFPRLVNDIVVAGSDITIGIGFDGSLNNLYANSLDIDEWPSTDGILSKEEAEKIFKDALSLKLQYAKENALEETKHYSLVYSPVYNEKSSTSIDATNGEWTSLFGNKEYPLVTHATAEEELNYLIQNNILEVKDSQFNANLSVSRGEALKILIKSISYFYDTAYQPQEENHQSFTDINPDSPYYQVVERAVSMGILDSGNGEFNASTDITREELAVWYIKALGLEQAAQHSEIYELKDIKDAKDVTYKGYVALAATLNILPAENGLFNPKKPVTYAEMAVSTIQLAHQVSENNNGYRYY